MNDLIIVKKGLELELKIKSLAYGGMGLAKIDNFVIFVKNAIPGQHVKALIYKNGSAPICISKKRQFYHNLTFIWVRFAYISLLIIH